jgi:hypothetical protein
MPHLQQWIAGAAAGVLAASLSLVPLSAQEPPKMKMTTDIPDGITTPDNIETQLGDLTFFDGVPDAETTEKVYNLYDFNQAYQAYLNGVKIASMDAMLRGIEEYGPAEHNGCAVRGIDGFAHPVPDAEHDQRLPDGLVAHDRRTDGDRNTAKRARVRQRCLVQICDGFRQSRPDEGQGGKFLILPPGFEGEVSTRRAIPSVVQTEHLWSLGDCGGAFWMKTGLRKPRSQQTQEHVHGSIRSHRRTIRRR